MIKPSASQTAPGAASQSSAVNTTQPIVESSSSCFLAACASAQVPISRRRTSPDPRRDPRRPDRGQARQRRGRGAAEERAPLLPRHHASARDRRRPEVEKGQCAADARRAHRVAGQARRPGIPAHRPAEDRFRRGHPNDAHIVRMVDWRRQYAFEQRGSDIHSEPRREQGIVRFRIDGVLHQVYQIPGAVLAAMTSRIKILGRMDVVEKRRPQDGRIKTRTLEQADVELRLSTLPTAFGEKIVMRIFDPEVLVRDFRELGFSDDDQKRWNEMTARPNGIVLVTGPTGSGKTTTLYSTLKALATPEVNVCTIEDPIEMVEPAFNQMQVQPAIELGFAEGVRALMRQDPDIIMIGEIRDLETAEMAVQSALTGHLVLSTLHTKDAPSAVARLLELGVAPYLLNATLNGVMAQRLVRTP